MECAGLTALFLSRPDATSGIGARALRQTGRGEQHALAGDAAANQPAPAVRMRQRLLVAALKRAVQRDEPLGLVGGAVGTDVLVPAGAPRLFRGAEFPVGVQGVREVHTLINTQWGTAGGPFAWIDFYGSNGVSFRKDLFSCDDIRDHAPDNQWCGEINGTPTINVWDNGQSGSAHIVLDKQQIVLPSEFWNETLESICVTDAGLGEYHQRLMFVGVTAGVPEPTALCLLAIGGVLAARRQR